MKMRRVGLCACFDDVHAARGEGVALGGDGRCT